MEQSVASSTGAQLISMTDLICPGTTCPLIFGTTPVYRDNQHLTATLSTVPVRRPSTCSSIRRRHDPVPSTVRAHGHRRRPAGSAAFPVSQARNRRPPRRPRSMPWTSPRVSWACSATPCRPRGGPTMGARRMTPTRCPLNLYPPLARTPRKTRRAHTTMAVTPCPRSSRPPAATMAWSTRRSRSSSWATRTAPCGCPRMEQIAADRGWRIHLLTKSACTPANVTVHAQGQALQAMRCRGARAPSSSSTSSSRTWSSSPRPRSTTLEGMPYDPTSASYFEHMAGGGRRHPAHGGSVRPARWCSSTTCPSTPRTPSRA